MTSSVSVVDQINFAGKSAAVVVSALGDVSVGCSVAVGVVSVGVNWEDILLKS